MILNIIVFLLLFLSVFVNGTTENDPISIAELKKTVLDNDVMLEQNANVFQLHNFNLFADMTRELLLGSRKPDFENFPTNLPFTELNTAQLRIYGQMLMLRKLYPFYAGGLHDTFKISALIIAVNKSVHQDHSLPNRDDIVGLVIRIIDMERDYVARQLDNAYKNLTDLYEELNAVVKMGNYWIVSNAAFELFQDRCAMPNSNCSLELQQAINMFLDIDKGIYTQIPVDRETKVETLLNILPERLKAHKEIKNALQASKHLCFPELDICYP